jgi:micrococcal nuclease
VPGEQCPQCSERRIGAFRFCLHCGFDYDAPPAAQPAALPATPGVAGSETEPPSTNVGESVLASTASESPASSSGSPVSTITAEGRRAWIRARLKEAEEPEGRVEAVTQEHIRPIAEPEQQQPELVGSLAAPAAPIVDRPPASAPPESAVAPVAEPALLVVSERPRSEALPAIPSLAPVRDDRYLAAGVAVILGLAAIVGLLRGPMPQLDSSKGLIASDAVAAASPIAPAGALASGPAIAQSSAGLTLPPTGSGAAGSPAPGTGPTGPTDRGLVVRIVDGDTVEVMIDRKVAVVRYLSIQVPGSEPNALTTAAMDTNRALVDRQTVILEHDVSDTDTDGRLLRHVWWQDPNGRYVLISEQLVREGLALVTTSLPDVKYADELDAAQRAAKADRIGLWAAPDQGASPSP